jgi:A/G-specific adenine glycosylase
MSILERRTISPESGETKSEFLLVKRPDKGLLAGMWEFPTVEQDQLQARHKISSLSTYKQRSESSREYHVEMLGLDWVKSCPDIQRRDLGSVQHLFSHIRKTYHAEWVLVQGQTADQEVKTAGSSKSKQKSVPETEWLSTEELAAAAIPTGINKTFQLLQKFKEANESLSGGKRKGTGAAGTVSNDGLGRDKKKVKKEAKKENAGSQVTLSAFFTRAK